jgi:hypothetical protein
LRASARMWPRRAVDWSPRHMHTPSEAPSRTAALLLRVESLHGSTVRPIPHRRARAPSRTVVSDLGPQKNLECNTFDIPRDHRSRFHQSCYSEQRQHAMMLARPSYSHPLARETRQSTLQSRTKTTSQNYDPDTPTRNETDHDQRLSAKPSVP